jgi:biofilm protein TabA
MILDSLENAHRYGALYKGFPKAVEFLLRPDLKDLPAENYAIDGDRIYAMVAKDSGRSKSDALLEVHERYIDIQLVLAGTDKMGWKSKPACNHPAGNYDNASDIQFFKDTPDIWLPVAPGFFVIFFPQDAHMPMISSGQLHKVVVKVAVE